MLWLICLNCLIIDFKQIDCILDNINKRFIMKKGKIPHENLHSLMIGYAIGAILIFISSFSMFFVSSEMTVGRITVYCVLTLGLIITVLTEFSSRKLQNKYQIKNKAKS